MSDYEVGYSKPPKTTQFTKGKSGNPNGRPKKTRSPTSLKELFTQPIKVTQNGRPAKIPVIEAIVTQLLRAAVKGDNPKLMKLALDYYMKLESREADTALADLLAASPFELSPEEEANIDKHKLLEGVT